MRSRSVALGLAAVALLGVGAVRARACGTDGIPSLLVNNRLVSVNTATASGRALTRWTPFVVHSAYRVGTPLTLREDKLKVTRSLPPMYFKQAWLWELGDGASARGLSITHTYRHPGDYMVTVKAYLTAGPYKQWATFDAVTIHVR